MSTFKNNLNNWCDFVTLLTESCSWTFGANTKLRHWGPSYLQQCTRQVEPLLWWMCHLVFLWWIIHMRKEKYSYSVGRLHAMYCHGIISTGGFYFWSNVDFFFFHCGEIWVSCSHVSFQWLNSLKLFMKVVKMYQNHFFLHNTWILCIRRYHVQIWY